MNVRFSIPTVLLYVVFSLGLAGCGDSEPEESAEQGADPHDQVITEDMVERPADFKEAVARIKTYRDAIERESAGAEPGLAHRPLDELTFVLEWLSDIAQASNVPKSQWATITKASDELRELFEQVHQNIDNRKDPDFPAVADAVDAAIGRLEAVAEAPPDEE